MALPGVGRVSCEGINRRENFWLEKPPKAEVGKVLTHMRRRGHQEEMVGAPAEGPARVSDRNPGEHLGQAIAVRHAEGAVRVPPSGELVSLVEDHEVVRRDVRILEPREHPIARERVDADDELTAIRTEEWVSTASLAARH